MRRNVTVLLTVALVAACAKAPPVTEPDLAIAAPERFGADTVQATPIVEDWWTTFDDPALEDLIAIALERNRDLDAAVARLDRAAAEARIAGADLKPALSVGTTWSRQVQYLGFLGEFPGGGQNSSSQRLPVVCS